MHAAKTMKPWVTFECLDCEEEFQTRHAEEDPDPECPMCWAKEREENRFQEMLESQVPPAVSKGIHGADVTYKMLEQSAGITDMHDNLREGDVAYKAAPSMTTSEQNEAIKAELQFMQSQAASRPADPNVQASWGGTQPQSNGIVGGAIANARGLSEQARAQSADPLGISQNWGNAPSVTPGTSRHSMPDAPAVKPKLRVLSRANKDGEVIPAVRRR